MTPAYIGIGSNLGASLATVQTALAELAALGTVRACSRWYCSAPIDSSGADYVNGVALLETALPAPQLLQALLEIEAGHGRERPYRNAPRTLDLDLLLYGAEIIALPQLQVPHPRMTERAFVLLPLLDIAPAIEIPGLGPASTFASRTMDQRIRLLAA
ncbi:2-amino-4-hydroxy-6-hydroxymethyldihydropteridine diphosphokinase [Massilia sp. W12]|uniref:2-amino-4-hydroxy-6- hydroxymethyldihydropteridine diphosphokinase n=1 Tax=Massilia sp. W12 TaxID=3126507 RepID=UPI0030CAA149